MNPRFCAYAICPNAIPRQSHWYSHGFSKRYCSGICRKLALEREAKNEVPHTVTGFRANGMYHGGSPRSRH